MTSKVTGWDNGLSQDYNRKLFRWFASRIDARHSLRKALSMTTKDEALKLALEACKRAINYSNNVVMHEGVLFDDDDDLPFIEDALAAGKEALAKPTSGDYALGYAEGFNDACKKPEQIPPSVYSNTHQPKQKPFGWLYSLIVESQVVNQKFSNVNWDTKHQPFGRHGVDHGGKVTKMPLYTTPPQREWVGLTDKEAMQICVDCGCLSEDWLVLLDAIEAKLKEKNT